MNERCEKLRTIFVSRCLTRDLLETNQITTSSQKFERGFLQEYAKISELEIVSIEKPFAKPEPLRCMDALISGSGYLNLVWRMREMKQSGVSNIVVTGYDLRVMLLLLAFRMRGIRAFAFIYDSHRQSLKESVLAKRILIELYFGMGFFLAKFLDGWIVLNDDFIIRNKINIPYKKIDVGVEVGQHLERQGSSIGKKPGRAKDVIILFSGTLNEDNGLHILVESFRSMTRSDLKLHIYGDGHLEEFARQSAQEDNRITFFGRIENGQLVRRQRDATYLVHLREPCSITSQYSYPSKLIEYLCSDTPVLSNLFPGIGEVADFVIPITDYSVAGVTHALAGLLDGTIPGPARTSASSWLAVNRGWGRIASEIESFVAGRGGTARSWSPRPC